MCPSKHQHGATLFWLFQETAPFQSPFKTRMGIQRLVLVLNPRVPTGGSRRENLLPMLPLVILLKDMKQNVLPQEMHVSNTKVLPIWLMQKWFIHLFRIVRERCIRHGQFDIQGGGAWVFGPGQNIFLRQNRSKIIFFAGPSGRIIFFSEPKTTFITYRLSRLLYA